METTLPFLQHFPLIGIFILLLLGGVGLPFPEDVTLILCGFLTSHGIVKPLPALAAVYAGVLIADILLFHIGRTFGRRIVTHRLFRRLLSAERLARLEQRFRKNGFHFVLFGRHLAGFRAQVFLAAGILGMPFGRFVAADAPSALATICIMGGIGYAGGNSLEIIRKDISRIEHIAVLVVLSGLIVYLLVRYRRSRRDARS